MGQGRSVGEPILVEVEAEVERSLVLEWSGWVED